MSQHDIAPRDDDRGTERDIARVSQELAGRLRARGVAVRDDESSEAIVEILEAVEAFERAVEARGGDLMMDEPPPGHAGQPDDPHFLLPRRADDETAAAYTARLGAATAKVRGHRAHE